MTEYVYPKRDKSWWGKSRDQLAYWIFCFGGWVATEWYAAMIEGSIRLGLDSARQEEVLSHTAHVEIPEKNDVSSS